MTRLQTLHGFRDGGDVLRRIAATAAHDVHEARFGEVGGVTGHVWRQQIEARWRERVRHARVRIGRHKAIRLGRQFFEEGAHLVRPERAIQTDRQRLHMPHRIEISLRDLTRNHCLATRADRGGNLDRQLDAIRFKHLTDRHKRGFGIERIENRLHHQGIDTASDQRADLMRVSRLHLIKGDVAEAQITEIRELRQ